MRSKVEARSSARVGGSDGRGHRWPNMAVATVLASLIAAGIVGCAGPQAAGPDRASSTPAATSAAHGLRGATSTSVAITGAVEAPLKLDVAGLKALLSSTVTIGPNTYTGVDLWTTLSKTARVKTDPSAMNGTIAMIVVATGSDGYRAVLSLAEIDPAFGQRPVLIAYAMNGSGLGRSGDIRLIVGGDARMGRSVSNLVSVDVLAPRSER